jgi:hypothetical protein
VVVQSHALHAPAPGVPGSAAPFIVVVLLGQVVFWLSANDTGANPTGAPHAPSHAGTKTSEALGESFEVLASLEPSPPPSITSGMSTRQATAPTAPQASSATSQAVLVPIRAL